MKPLRHPPSARGYHAIFRRGEVNRCPGCQGRSWHVGRISAECAACGTALDLAEGAVLTVSPAVERVAA